MAYKALYRSYRPNSFNSVIGQEHIIQTLKNALINKKTSHAYIFSGPRGIGKTTIARILAKAINCEDLQNGEPCNKCASCKLINNSETPDIVEFDAASNNGVEEIRNILEKVNFLPSVLRHKVYIIDEVHMLSMSAFNALLKTLEEPPAHVMFILATTEVHKIPATILSRCQRFDFKPLTVKEIKNNLKNISEKEKIDVEEEALNLMAEASEGGMRDAIGILDQVNAYSTKTITLENVNNVTGRISNQKLVELMQAIKDNNSVKAVEITNELVSMGKEVSRLVQSLLQLCRDVLLYQSTGGEVEGKLIYDDMSFKMLSGALNKRKIFYYIDVLSDVQNKIKFSLSQKIFLEVGIMKMATATTEDFGGSIVSVAGDISEDLENRISVLENQLGKVKSELVHLNLVEFKNETKEKLHELEDSSNNSFVTTIPNEVIERLEKLESKLREMPKDNLLEEINIIKEQLNGNNNFENADELLQKVVYFEESLNIINEKLEELDLRPDDSSNEEWLKIEDSIKLVSNQMEEVSQKVQELEGSMRPKEPTLFDFDSESNDDIIRLTNELNELKEQLETLKQTYTHVEESLNELILNSKEKEDNLLQKRANPYEQKVLDIVEQQHLFEALVEEPTEASVVEEDEETIQEELFVEEAPAVITEENQEESLVEEDEETIQEELFVEDVPAVITEENQEELLVENDAEEPVEKIVVEEEQEELPEEEAAPEELKQIQFNLYDLYNEETEKKEQEVKEETVSVPVIEKIEEKASEVVVSNVIPDINDFVDERPVELHYEISCNIDKLEKDLRVMNLSEEVPLDVLNRVVGNLTLMKDDIITLINDKQNNVYRDKPTLESDAKRNIKTFLILLSGRDTQGSANKDSEVAALISEVKELIKEYRNVGTAPIRPIFVPQPPVVEKEVIEEKVDPVQEEVEEKTTPVVEEQQLEEEIKEEQKISEEPVANEVINESPLVEEPKVEEPKYIRATILDTKPRHVETMVNKEPDDNPYAIEKLEAVMHDSRSEISREERKIILSNWRKLGDRVGTALSPVAKILMDGQPVVNGNNCVVITYPNAALCNHVMSEKIRFQAKQILKITYGREYDFMALPEDVWQEKRNEYRGQYQMGSKFPKLSPINNPELKIIKNSFVDEKSASYNSALDLFGENLIKEEE